MSFLSKISAYDDSLEVVDTPKGQRSIGRSLASYLRGDVMGRVMDSVARGRGDDDMLMGVACHLSSLSRSTRREYLTRMSPVVRRKLLDIGVSLQQKVKDSAIDYAPQVCWAISSVMDDGLGDGYQWLNSQVALPKDVDRWFKAYKDDPYSGQTHRAASALGRYRLVEDDARLSEYMDGASGQEEGLQAAIDEGAELGASLSEAAAEVLSNIHESVKEKTSSFLSSLMSTYEEGITDVISKEVMEVTGAQTDDILEEDVESDLESLVPNEDGELVEEEAVLVDEALDGDLGKDPFDNHFGAGGMGESSVEDAVSQKGYITRRSRKINDCALEEVTVEEVAPEEGVAEVITEVPVDVPATPFAVGVPVQVSYMGNLYNGRVSAAGNGSIVVEGLPFEYFTARSANGSFTGTMADMTFDEDYVTVVEEVMIPEETVVALEEPVEPRVGEEVAVVEEPAEGVVGDVIIEGVGDSAAGYDERRAEALTQVFDVTLDDIEFDGRYYRDKTDNEAFLVLEEEELIDEGLFAGEADATTFDYYIYRGEHDAAPERYSVHREKPSWTKSEEAFMDDLGYRGLGKLIAQINNLSPGFFDVWIDVIGVGDQAYEALCVGHSYVSGVEVEPEVVVLYEGAGPNDGYWYYKKLIGPGIGDGMILVADKKDMYAAMQRVVDIFEAYGGVSKEDLGMLKQSLRAELMTPIGDAVEGAPAEVSPASVIARVVGGDELSSGDGEYTILYDEGFVLFVTPDSTVSVEESEAGAYLAEHRSVFGPALDLVFSSQDSVTDDAEDVTITEGEKALSSGQEEIRTDVTTQEDVDGEVITMHEDERTYTIDLARLEALSTVTRKWGMSWCFTLSQSVENAVRLDAAKSLSTAITEVGFDDVRVDATVPEVQLHGSSLAAFKVDGLYIGSVLFIYQTSDSGIANFATGVSSEVVSLVRKLMDYTVTTSSVSEEVHDDGSGSLLTETVKQEVVTQVEEKVKEALEKVGLSVEDSAPVVSTGGFGAPAVNTYDIPHTAATFHRVRDYGRVMDSVLSVASELLGERVSASQYRSMLKSGSKKCAEKVQRVVDSAVMLDALDVLCPALYKERMTDAYWVCDSVADVEKVFKWKSGVLDGRCLVSKEPLEGAAKVSVGKSSVYIKMM